MKKRGAGRDDPELVAGSSAHYEDPSYYQRNYARRKDDVAFYVDLAKSAPGKRRVLEYGCGNGRITLPMARTGARVTGVDLSRPMLDDLEKRLAGEPEAVRERVRVVRGDMRTARLEAKGFDRIVCPFNAFLHLYERRDVEQFLERVGYHLAPGAELVFDVSVPDASELARNPEKLYRTRPFVYPGLGKVRYGERFDYDPLRQILFVSMEFEPASGDPSFMTPLSHRQFYPRELEALLHYNGFEVTKLIGDFDGRPVTTTRQLCVFAKRSRR